MEPLNSNSAPTLDSSSSNQYPTLTTSNLTSKPSTQISEEEEKHEILNNYVPDLSNYQQISFKIKNNNKVFMLYPDVNFEENKKGYYIFYNNNLALLKDFFTAELERLKKEHPWVLHHIGEFLNELDEKYDADTYYDPMKLISRLISYGYQPMVDKARSIAKNLIKINKIEKIFGKDLKNRICEVIVNDDKERIFDDFVFFAADFFILKSNKSTKDKDKLSKRIENLGKGYLNEKEILYFEAESKFRELENIYKDKLNYIIELEKLLDIYMQEIGENATETEKIKFLCFILNRASYYLAHPSEQLLGNNSLEILKQLSKLRRKINNLLLTYRYKFEQNKRPILDIQIARYKSLIDTFETTSIYIQPAEVKKFIEDLEDSLERKANNLKKDKNFDSLSIEQIREIVRIRDGNLSSNEKIIQAVEEKIDELEEKISAAESEMLKIAGEVSLKVVKKGIEIVFQVPPTQEKENPTPNENQKKAIERINELNNEKKKLQKQVNNYKNKLEKLKINQNYDIEFINILKLYSQLYRRNYHLRIDYSGLILSEKRKLFPFKDKNNVETMEEMVNLREYEIKEISK